MTIQSFGRSDTEIGLDFAQSRYYSPMHGRFTSPDEFKGGPDELFDFEQDASDNPTFYADLENPQSLNKYQYGYNNPYKYNDPSGHCPPCSPAQVFLGPTIIETIPILTPKSAVVPRIAPMLETGTVSAGRTGMIDPILIPNLPLPSSRVIGGQRATAQAGGQVSQGAGRVLQNSRPKNLKPVSDARGPHSTVRRNSQGKVTRYTTWRKNPKSPNGFEPKKSVDTKPGGKPHRNSRTKEDIQTPHVQGKDIPGKVRPARKNELPKD